MQTPLLLTRQAGSPNSRLALNGHWLPEGWNLTALLQLPQAALLELLPRLATQEAATGPLLAPLDPTHEVWASGVTYLRSREAREAESEVADVYQKVYEAARPELFFKASGWRVIGPDAPIRVRPDSQWNVPEPELVLVINRSGEIVGFVAGNDVSSRSIEGENPLYLPQAKVYNGSCALGPAIQLIESSAELVGLPVHLSISRAGQLVFEGETGLAQMKRRPAELVKYLFDELDFPGGTFLMTGTGIVPPDSFSLQPGDRVDITIGDLTLSNGVGA